MSDSKPHIRQDVQIIWRALRDDSIAQKALANLDQQFRSLEEQIDTLHNQLGAESMRCEKAEGDLKRTLEQFEALRSAAARARHELDQWVFADGSAAYRVQRAEEILDVALGVSYPAKERP